MTGTIEKLRRFGFLLGVMAAVWLTCLAYAEPYIIVRWKAPDSVAARAPKNALLADGPHRKTVAVSGEAWEALFEEAAGKRTSLYFRPESLPQTVAEVARQNPDCARLADPGRGCLSVAWLPGREASLGSGGPWDSYIPTDFFYPRKRLAPWALGVAAALYLLLPWPRRPPECVCFSRWRIVLMDVAAMLLLILPFASLPFLIVGDSVATVTEYWMMCLFFWPLAFLGLTLLPTTVLQAVTRIDIAAEGLRWLSAAGWEDVPFASLEKVERVVALPPRWLVVLMWLRAFSGGGGGANAAGAAGQAMLLSSQAAQGLCFHDRAGTRRYLWHTDSQGGLAMRNFDRLEEALAAAGLTAKNEGRTIRRLFPPQREER